MATTFVRLALISVPLAIGIVYLSGMGRGRSRPSAGPVEVAPAPAQATAPTAGPGPSDVGVDQAEQLSSSPVGVDGPAEKFTVTLTAKRDDVLSARIDGSEHVDRRLVAGGRTLRADAGHHQLEIGTAGLA